MEFSHVEVQEIQATAADVQERQTVELDDLQLTFAGGGNVIVTCG